MKEYLLFYAYFVIATIGIYNIFYFMFVINQVLCTVIYRRVLAKAALLYSSSTVICTVEQLESIKDNIQNTIQYL